MCETGKYKLEASLKFPESELYGTQERVQELELTKDIDDELTIKVDETEQAFDSSQEHVQYLQDLVAELSKKLLAKDTEAVI